MGSILVVEDDEDLATLVAAVIRDEGHDVRVAANGRDALDEVAKRMPDLILLDMRMPVMSGVEFMAEFRRRYEHAARIVVMTAAESAAARAREVGADAWLAKPFHPGEILRLVESFAGSPYRSPGAAD